MDLWGYVQRRLGQVTDGLWLSARPMSLGMHGECSSHKLMIHCALHMSRTAALPALLGTAPRPYTRTLRRSRGFKTLQTVAAAGCAASCCRTGACIRGRSDDAKAMCQQFAKPKQHRAGGPKAACVACCARRP